jgi:hypothetical protein
VADDVIGMDDMRVVFAVTDALGIHRERVSVSLEKEDPGVVRRLPSGEVEIVVPKTAPLEEWVAALKRGLEELGFSRPGPKQRG